MANAKTKSKSNMFSIIAIILVLALAVGAVFLLSSKQDNKPASVMELDVNPHIQFVLNAQDRVVAVNYLNEDAENIFNDVDFTNKSAQEAAKLFVDMATKSGHISIDINGSGEEVNIVISGKTDVDMSELKNKVVETVNKYFYDNGILAKAVGQVKEGFEQALSNVNSTITDIANKTEEEILESLQNLDKVSLNLQSQFFTLVDQAKQNIALFDTYVEQFKQAKEALNNNLEEIKALKKELEKNANDIKLQVELTTKEALTESLQKALDEAEKVYDEVMKQLNEKIEKIVEDIEKQSKEAFEEIKNEYKNQVKAFEEQWNNYKNQFEDNKADYQQKIQEFQNANA